MQVWKAPRGRGAYGMTITPKGDVWYASLAGSHIAKIDLATGNATVVEPPTPNQGARRVWSRFDRAGCGSASGTAATCRCTIRRTARGRPGSCRASGPRTYSVYVDDKDKVWLTDFGANAIVRFDPVTEKFTLVPERQARRQRAPDGRHVRAKRGAASPAPTGWWSSKLSRRRDARARSLLQA